METKKLTSQESLDLITEMIQNSKQNFSNKSGNSLIIWGVTSFSVTLIIILLMLFVQNTPMFNWLFMLIPIIGQTWGKIAVENKRKVYTQIDKMLKQLWQIIMIVAIAIPIFITVIALCKVNMITAFSENQLFILIPLLEVLIVSIGLAVTGAVIDFKACKIGGLIGVALSVLPLIANVPLGGTYFMFLVWPIACMIIPGIELNRLAKARKDV